MSTMTKLIAAVKFFQDQPTPTHPSKENAPSSDATTIDVDCDELFAVMNPSSGRRVKFVEETFFQTMEFGKEQPPIACSPAAAPAPAPKVLRQSLRWSGAIPPMDNAQVKVDTYVLTLIAMFEMVLPEQLHLMLGFGGNDWIERDLFKRTLHYLPQHYELERQASKFDKRDISFLQALSDELSNYIRQKEVGPILAVSMCGIDPVASKRTAEEAVTTTRLSGQKRRRGIEIRATGCKSNKRRRLIDPVVAELRMEEAAATRLQSAWRILSAKKELSSRREAAIEMDTSDEESVEYIDDVDVEDVVVSMVEMSLGVTSNDAGDEPAEMKGTAWIQVGGRSLRRSVRLGNLGTIGSVWVSENGRAVRRSQRLRMR